MCWDSSHTAGAGLDLLLPKLIGQPIQSYNLSLLGFWGLAFLLRSQVGGHHLISGPVPGWLVTLSIVQSMMMILPVAAFTVNSSTSRSGPSVGAASFTDPAVPLPRRSDVPGQFAAGFVRACAA